jgi:hypothetical protein
VGDGITPGEESIEDAVARLNRESAAAQARARADREARDARPAPRSAPSPRPAQTPPPARPAVPAPNPVPGNVANPAPGPYQAAYGAMSAALAKQGWTGSGVRPSPGSPGTDAVLIPSYAVQLAWGRIIGGAVATFIGFQFSNWIVPDPFGLLFVAPGLIWLATGLLRLRGAGRERAWGDHHGLHLVDRAGERVVPWRDLSRVEVVQRGSSSDKRRARIELTLADGTRLKPRMWDGAVTGQVRLVADRINAARAGFTRHG